MEPRKPGDVRRIIGRAGYASAEADLKELDQLLSEESFMTRRSSCPPLKKEKARHVSDA